MKIISNEHSLVTQHFIADEVRPAGGLNVLVLIRMLGERYQFGALPTVEDTARTGAKFREGRLISGSRKINVREIGVFSDSISVTSYNTSDAEFVLDDVFAWAQEAFGLRQSITPFRRSYLNTAIIEFDQSIDGALARFEKFRQAFQVVLQNAYGSSTDVSISRLAFSTDPGLPYPIPTTEFTVERRVGSPYPSHRYFSAAPLSTEAHMDLLTVFENSLSL